MARPNWTRRGAAAASAGLLVALAACTAGEGPPLGEVHTLAASGASNPTLARAAGGDALLVAWVAHGEVGGDVYFARVGPDGTPEGEPVRVNHVAGDADPHEQAPAQVAVGPGGEVYVIWQRKVDAPWLDYGGADLRLARSTDGGRTFGPALTVNDNPPGSPARISFHDLAVAPDGTVHVSWIDARERDAVREAVYRAAEAGGSAAAPAGPEPGTEIRIATSRDGGQSFGPSVVVDGDTCPCCRTSLAIGADGAVYVAWRKVFEGGIRDIALARSDDGGRTFSEPKAIHVDGWEFPGCPHAGPSLALDAEGRLHAAWYTGKEGRQGLWYAVSSDRGDSFGEPAPVLTDAWVPPSQARLSIAGGEVWVAWDDLREAEARRVRVARLEGGTLREAGDAVTGNSPALEVGAGLGGVAWQDGDAVRFRAIEAGTGGAD